MTITQLIEALEDIRTAHGDLPVLHENDWTTFLVTMIRVEPANDGQHPFEDCKWPTHVVLDDRGQFYDCQTGELTPPDAT